MNASHPLRAFVDRHPTLKATLKAIVAPFRRGTSTDYSRLAAADVADSALRLKDAWQNSDIPARQREGVDRQLAAYRAGAPDLGFDVLVEMLEELLKARPAGRGALTLLEVGCSSGYHSEVLEIKGLPVVYSGCDYSPTFIQMARRYYPSRDFQVQDATSLGYGEGTFDVVISGCCLLHIVDYEAAIREAARVAGSWVLFHRTPVLHKAPTTYYTKRAYGVETVEIHFSERELVSLFVRHGLAVIGISTLHVGWQGGDAFATKSYLCRKARG